MIHWRSEEIPRLVVGTAQLGTPYGIANGTGQPSRKEALGMVEAAWERGVRFFDTAQAYGESEAVLGEAFRALGISGEACVTTKIGPRLPLSIERSCERLGCARLWGLMLHRAEWLGLWDGGFGESLEQARSRGLVRYLGVSVYSVEQARDALAHASIDFIQAPCNAWDQRMLRAGIFELAAERGKLCFVRSIYLQGLLTLGPEAVRGRLPRGAEASLRWQRLAERFGVPPAVLAFRFALSLPAPLVIGMETREQVLANAALFGETPLESADIDQIDSALADTLGETILNPSLWSLAS